MTRGASRYDDQGEWRHMTQHSNYVMARRPGRAPTVFSRREWDAMPRRPLCQVCLLPTCNANGIASNCQMWGKEVSND